MGKISPVSAKYIIHASIHIEGVVEKPDVIGAIFGQTEGLLGEDLELRELQKSGRIGRIEVNTEVKNGKTEGDIIIPSSLDKTETSIVAAALETIQRIGPCNAKVKVEKMEDVRILKRSYVTERAKEILKQFTETSLPDSQEMADEVSTSVRVMGISEYGPERLPAGPGIEESEEIILVEGRADILNLLRHGFKNTIALNGTSMPPSIRGICKEKIVTLFVDGDRGGSLIVKEVTENADIDFVAKAPDGKEVEELAKKEIHQALRAKVSVEQAKAEMKAKEGMQMQPKEAPRAPRYRTREDYRKPFHKEPYQRRGAPRHEFRPRVQYGPMLVPAYKEKFKQLLEDLIGTRGAYILDDKLNILGKVPTTELPATIKSLGTGIFAVVFDGNINSQIVQIAEKIGIKFLVGMESEVKQTETKVGILVSNTI